MVASSHFAGRPVCYPVTERCNYQLYCADGSDERDCTVCQPGTFHCDSDRSVCVRLSRDFQTGVHVSLCCGGDGV